MGEHGGPAKMPASKAQRAATAARRSKAIALRMAGRGYQQIADELGYASAGAAYTDITRALETNVAEQRRAVDLYREEELLRLDERWRRLETARDRVLEVLVRRHLTVSHGKVIFHEDEPLLDDGPVLQAVDRLLHVDDRQHRIQERRARYLGLDAPQRHEVTLDEIDREIRELSAELGIVGDGEAGEAAGAASSPPDQG